MALEFPQEEISLREGQGQFSRVNHRGISPVESAILQAVAYADVFDYPLTPSEIQRYLVGVRSSREEVKSVLSNGGILRRCLARQDGYFSLAGREAIIDIRLRRAATAARMWPRAVSYGEKIAALPFVRMVCVTGALAVDNVESEPDIDYLIVTEPGRLWLCRVLVIVVKKIAWLLGDQLCPNYFLSERALVLDQHNLFTAHELAQMVPISGISTYHRMRTLNDWTTRFLPNVDDRPPRQDLFDRLIHFSEAADAPSGRFSLRALAEAVLRTQAGGCMEQWEMSRKVRKYTAQSKKNGKPERRSDYSAPAEATFCADWCKGHFEKHGRRTMEAFANRLSALPIVLSHLAEPERGIEAGTRGEPS